MMSRRTQSAFAFTICAALVAAIGIAVVYAGQIDVGLYYDDYHFVRPLFPLDLHRVWFGSWDPAGIESVFYRPLTAYLFAGRFWLFGLNTTAMHAVSIAVHALCAVMVGWFLRRAGSGTGIALLGVLLYAAHPSLPQAQVSWLTNQMHLTESLMVLLTLLTWQGSRERSLLWLPIAVLAIAIFLVKEDGLMLLPSLVLLTALRSVVLRTGLPTRWPLLLGSGVALCGALVALRFERLGRLGGYGVPTLATGYANFTKGIGATLFLWPTRTPWQAVASGMAILAIAVGLAFGRWRHNRRLLFVSGLGLAIALCFNLPPISFPRSYPLFAWQALASGVAISTLVIGAGVALWRADRQSLFVITAGCLLVLAFNTPFVLVSKREQYHLLTLGGVLALTGAAQALATIPVRPSARIVLVLLLVAALLPFPLLARSQAAAFLPCAANVLELDKEARGWWVVPEELRHWMDDKANRCRDNAQPTPLTDIPQLAWGVYPEGPAGTPSGSRWTSDRAVFLLKRDAAVFSLALRRSDATSSQPVRVTLRSGTSSVTILLDSDEKKYATLRLRPGLLVTLRQNQRVDVTVDGWFVPAVRDPRSSDLRRFGVAFDVVEIH